MRLTLCLRTPKYKLIRIIVIFVDTLRRMRILQSVDHLLAQAVKFLLFHKPALMQI